jgi:Ca-activated chloride channel family protein
MLLHFAYLNLIYILGPIFALVVLYRWKFYKYPTYVFPLTQQLIDHNIAQKSLHKKILFLIRFALIGSLTFLILRPQWVDERSKVNVDGIDIIMAIDVSGSMTYFDDTKDQRQRIEVAKQEAIRFIEKRTEDPIGIVIFGKEAVSRCPLTLDKQILKEIVGELEIGIVDPDGTWLGTGLATAVNRLRNSKAKSKVIILLTDGEPTPPEKIEPDLAITLAQKYGIKVYTIGIGSESGCYTQHPFGGIVQIPTRLDFKLLDTIAEKTGGLSFRAKNPKEMRSIYDKIDALEKTQHQTNIFHRYYEAFLSFVWILLALIGAELIIRFFIWPGVLS